MEHHVSFIEQGIGAGKDLAIVPLSLVSVNIEWLLIFCRDKVISHWPQHSF